MVNEKDALIGEFMGQSFVALRNDATPTYNIGYVGQYFDTVKDCQLFCDGLNARKKSFELPYEVFHEKIIPKYHEDWNQLMPVLKAILRRCEDFEDFYKIRDNIPDINSTYKAVLEYIKKN